MDARSLRRGITMARLPVCPRDRHPRRTARGCGRSHQRTHRAEVLVMTEEETESIDQAQIDAALALLDQVTYERVEARRAWVRTQNELVVMVLHGNHDAVQKIVRAYFRSDAPTRVIEIEAVMGFLDVWSQSFRSPHISQAILADARCREILAVLTEKSSLTYNGVADKVSLTGVELREALDKLMASGMAMTWAVGKRTSYTATPTGLTAWETWKRKNP